MKYGLVCLLVLCLSLDVSAGFLKKMTKGIGSVLDPEAAEQKKQEELKAERQKQAALAKKDRETEEKKKQAKLAAEKEKQEKEYQKYCKELEATRSGKVAYALKGVQWGDSPEVLKEICGLKVESNVLSPEFLGAFSYSSLGNEGEVMNEFFSIDPEVGLFRVEIQFTAKVTGVSRTVTLKDLIEKYKAKNGKPEVLYPDRDYPDYKWVTSDNIIVVHGVYTGFEYCPGIVLESPEINKKLEEALRTRAEKAENERKAKAGNILDF